MGCVMTIARLVRIAAAIATVVAAATAATSATANPFLLLPFQPMPQAPVERAMPNTDEQREAPAGFRRQVVDYRTTEAPGTIIIDTPNTHLYLVLGNGKAIRYGIGVGREGFTWSGVKTVERKAEWPDWTPPPEMIARSPYLPRFMAGGVTNPLGARAMYLSGTFYRIHGTNAPSTIGSRATAGCIRMANEDVIDLYDRVKVGAKVVVLPAAQRHATGMFSALR
jgi:lipoprotein-anchoring transpeptidase ErfK/SrfK